MGLVAAALLGKFSELFLVAGVSLKMLDEQFAWKLKSAVNQGGK